MVIVILNKRELSDCKVDWWLGVCILCLQSVIPSFQGSQLHVVSLWLGGICK